MRASTLFALGAGTASAAVIQAREPTLGLLSGLLGSIGLGVGLTTSGTSSSSGSTTPSTPSGTGSGPCAGRYGPSSTYATPNGDIWGICINTDFLYSDSINVPGTSYSSCAQSCSAYAGCVAGSFDRPQGLCYLKIATPSGCVNADVDSVYRISAGGSQSTTKKATPTATTSSAIATGTGPCANGVALASTYVASNGDVYGVCLDTDFVGGDWYSVGNINSVGSCAEACTQASGCVGASLIEDTQVCYLKSTVQPACAEKGHDSVYKISSAPKVTTTSKTTTSKSTTTSCTTTPRTTTSSTTTARTTTCTTASTTPSTTPTTVPSATTSHTPSVPTCGLTGFDKQSPAASKSDSTGKYADFSSCKAFCAGSSSFAVGGGYCLCYNGPVSGNINAAPSSPYIFYDMNCSAPPAGTTTVGISASSIAQTVAATSTARAATTASSGCSATVTVTTTATVTVTAQPTS